MSTAGAGILVVDDEPTNRDILERRLVRLGHRVFTAGDGRQCLDFLATHECDLVLLDIMMPVLDGMATLAAIRANHSPNQLPVIMTTARDGTEDIVGALQAGANDYVTKPIDFAVLLARLDTQLRLKRTTAELDRAYNRIKRELEAAARVQRAQIPASGLFLQGVRCACRYLPCEELAGDILNYFVLNEEQLALYLLDVSGHGAGAALLSSGLGRLLTVGDGGEQGLVGATPVEILARLNRRFPLESETSQFFTILYATVEPRKRLLRYASAGHPGPLIIKKDGTVVRATSTGLPVGVMEQAVFTEEKLCLAGGEQVLFFSDGVTEARDARQRQFGMERLINLLAGAGNRDLEDLMDVVIGEVQEWSEGRPQDDISLVGLEFQ